MKKRFRIGKLLFLSAAPDGDVVSIYRPTSKCRPTATLSVTAQSASLGSLCGAARARASAAASAFFSSQFILPGLRPGNPLAASSVSYLDLIEGQLIFARRGRVW
jgi:hypothetical protein